MVKSLNLDGSQVRFSKAGSPGSLTVDTLTASNSQFVMNTDGKTADTVTVNQSLSGKNIRWLLSRLWLQVSQECHP